MYPPLSACMYVCMHTVMRLYVNVCVQYVCASACSLQVRMQCVCVFMYVYICICMYVCVCACLFVVYVCMYT